MASPVWQWIPEYPVAHEHEPTPLLFRQVPPLPQVTEAHEGPGSQTIKRVFHISSRPIQIRLLHICNYKI